MNDGAGKSDSEHRLCWCWKAHACANEGARCSLLVRLGLSLAYLTAIMPYVVSRQHQLKHALVPSLNRADAILYLAFLLVCVPAIFIVGTLIANHWCERLLLEGRIAAALRIFRLTKWLDSGLRSTMPDRSRFLVLVASFCAAQTDSSIAEQLLREALRMPVQLSETAELVFGKSQSGREVDRAQFLNSISVASLELAFVCNSRGDFQQAHELCAAAMEDLQSYRVNLMRDMSLSEVKAKTKVPSLKRWMALSKVAPPATRLAAVDLCLNDATALRAALMQTHAHTRSAAV